MKKKKDRITPFITIGLFLVFIGALIYQTHPEKKTNEVVSQDPIEESIETKLTKNSYVDELYYYTAGPDSSENYNLWDPLYFYDWIEEKVYGGNDYLYSVSKAQTQEVRFDYTNQITEKWRTRIGVDYKTHKLNYFEVKKDTK